jgi:hypothetical protein
MVVPQFTSRIERWQRLGFYRRAEESVIDRFGKQSPAIDNAGFRFS